MVLTPKVQYFSHSNCKFEVYHYTLILIQSTSINIKAQYSSYLHGLVAVVRVQLRVHARAQHAYVCTNVGGRVDTLRLGLARAYIETYPQVR